MRDARFARHNIYWSNNKKLTKALQPFLLFRRGKEKFSFFIAARIRDIEEVLYSVMRKLKRWIDLDFNGFRLDSEDDSCSRNYSSYLD